MSQSENPQQSERRGLINSRVSELCEGLGLRVEDERILFYGKALDDLSETQIQHGFDIARRNLGAFLPSVENLRQWCESWRPAGFEQQFEKLEKSMLTKAAVKLHVSKEQIAEWMEDGKIAQQEHYAKLAEDPDWQALYEQFGKPGLSPRPSRNWDSEEAKAQWATETAKSQGWAK